MDYTLLKNIPNHLEIQIKVTGDIWPEFMFHDPVSNENWLKLFEWFPQYQISMVSGEDVVGIANSIPYYWDKLFEELPDEGWDWTILKGTSDYANGISPNVLSGLQVSVNKSFLGKGISPLLTRELLNLAKENGFKYVTIPVRPTLKSKYPLIPMDNYMRWKNPDGLPFDPWLRVHVKCGAKLIKPCNKAMYIPGTVSDWEDWTKMKLPVSGDYIVEGALTPVKIDIDKDLGEYTEPNVWVLYTI